MDFLVIVHISIAIILILLVLVQDSKGAMGSTFGGGGSNTLFGATGVENVLTKSTKVVVVFFAITCILLTRLSSENKDSVLDTEGYRPTEAVPAEAVPESTKQAEGQVPVQEDKSTEKGANKKSTDNSQNKQESNSKDNVKSDPKKAVDAPPSTEETK